MAKLSSYMLFLGTVIFLSLAAQNTMGSQDQHKDGTYKQVKAALKNFKKYSANLRNDDDEDITGYLSYLPLYMLLNGSQFTQGSIIITFVAALLGYVVAHDFLTIALQK